MNLLPIVNKKKQTNCLALSLNKESLDDLEKEDDIEVVDDKEVRFDTSVPSENTCLIMMIWRLKM